MSALAGLIAGLLLAFDIFTVVMAPFLSASNTVEALSFLSGVPVVGTILGVSSAFVSTVLLLLAVIGGAGVIGGFVYAWRTFTGRGHARWVGLSFTVLGLVFLLGPPNPIATAMTVAGVVSVVAALLPRAGHHFELNRAFRFQQAAARRGPVTGVPGGIPVPMNGVVATPVRYPESYPVRPPRN